MSLYVLLYSVYCVCSAIPVHIRQKFSSVKSLASWLPYSIIIVYRKVAAFAEAKQHFNYDRDYSVTIFQKTHLLQRVREQTKTKAKTMPYLGFCILPCNYLFSLSSLVLPNVCFFAPMPFVSVLLVIVCGRLFSVPWKVQCVQSNFRAE